MKTPPFPTEDALQNAMAAWFDGFEYPLPYKRHPSLACGSIPDFSLLLTNDGEPWCCLELKNGLDIESTSVSDLAEYYEQCLKYRLKTGLPTFLGPFFIGSMGVSSFLHGGAEPKYATSAFGALAGRTDVGLFFIHCTPGHETDPTFWYGMRMTLRQKTVAQFSTDSLVDATWPDGPVSVVSLDGAASNKVRT